MKKNTFRRFLALALSMILCFSLMSTIALAQSPDETTNDTPTIKILTPVDVLDVTAEVFQEAENAAESDTAATAGSTLNEGESEPAEAADSEDVQDEEKTDETAASDVAGTDEGTPDNPDAADDSDAKPADSNTDASEEDKEDETTSGQPEGENPEQSEEEETKTDETTSDNADGEKTDDKADAEDPDKTDGEETSGEDKKDTDEITEVTPTETPADPAETPDAVTTETTIQYGDKGVTADGINWEFTCDSTTGKYTLSFKLDKTSEDGKPSISDEMLAAMEEYAAEVSRELAEKYGVKWEWDSAAAPSEDEDVQKFQVFLTSDQDHTYKYNSITLEQMDGEFTLEKVDSETGRPITGSEASFHLWHVNEVIDSESGEKVDVKMYCSYDADTHTYTFAPTEATIQTIGGRLEILYAMMKDTVYYLQETIAPDGYDVDPSVHIVIEKDVWESKEESFRKDFNYLGEFTEDENGRIGLDIRFEDIKSYGGNSSKIDTTPMLSIPEEPAPQEDPIPWADPVPSTPDLIIVPSPTDTDIPEPAPTPEPTIIPEPEPEPEYDTVPDLLPDPEATPIPEPVIDMNDIPRTGDLMHTYMLISLISAGALIALLASGRKKSTHK